MLRALEMLRILEMRVLLLSLSFLHLFTTEQNRTRARPRTLSSRVGNPRNPPLEKSGTAGADRACHELPRKVGPHEEELRHAEHRVPHVLPIGNRIQESFLLPD